MNLFSGYKKKKIMKRREEYCREAKIFIQVHFVNEHNNSRYTFNTLSLKDDPMRDECAEWYSEHGNPNTFSKIVTAYISSNDISAESLCQKAGFEPKYFDKLAKSVNYHPGKGEAVAVCFGLKLNIEHARTLLNIAGHPLSNSLNSDLIIRYFLENNIYSIGDLNYVLEELADVRLKDII